MTSTDTTNDYGASAPWSGLLDRWDAQQSVYVEGRERGYAAMLDALEALVPGPLRAVDLAGGPGSLSQRLLDRRTEARCVSVDFDPVLQAVGRGALGDMGGRLRWVAADVRDHKWTAELGEEAVDAVLTSTALHYLPPPALAELYHSLGRVVRPGGVLLNFDGLPGPRHASRIGAASDAIDSARQQRAVADGADAWEDWWNAARRVPELRESFAARDAILTPARGRIFEEANRKKRTGLAFHEAALIEAGFTEVDVLWQDLSKKVLVAVR